MRLSASAAGALAALVLVVGCASPAPTGDGDPTPTPTVTSTEPTPSPDPAPTADAGPGVAGIIIRTERILLVDASGEVLGEHDYYAPAAPFIAALTEAFGAEPDVEEPPGGAGHAVPTTVSRWQGFEVFDAVTEASKPAVSDFFVRATARP